MLVSWCPVLLGCQEIGARTLAQPVLGWRKRRGAGATFSGTVSVPLATTPAQQSLTIVEKLRLTGEIVSTYARVRWLVARHSLPDVLAQLRATDQPRASSVPTMSAFNKWRLANAIVRVLRRLPTDSRCLMRSLVVLRMLHRRGVSSSLVIGVKTEPEFAAHAWIEESGEALLPTGGDAIHPLTTL